MSIDPICVKKWLRKLKHGDYKTIIKSGYLSKKGGFRGRKRWQTRFFVLTLGSMRYYGKEKDYPNKPKGTVNLSGARLFPVSQTKRPLGFQVVCPQEGKSKDGGRQFFLEPFPADEQSKKDWLAVIACCIPQKLFSLPLEVAALRSDPEGLIPSPIRQCTEWLEKHALDEEGLYRKPGSKQVVEDLILQFDSQEKVVLPERSFGGNMASTVVQYLRRLPESPFTAALESSFSKAELLCGESDDPNPNKHDAMVEAYRTCLLKLPAPNFHTIRHLCNHFTNVLKYSDDNMMTASKLGMCVYSGMARTFQLLTEHYDAIFGDLEHGKTQKSEAKGEGSEVDEPQSEVRADESSGGEDEEVGAPQVEHVATTEVEETDDNNAQEYEYVDEYLCALQEAREDGGGVIRVPDYSPPQPPSEQTSDTESEDIPQNDSDSDAAPNVHEVNENAVPSEEASSVPEVNEGASSTPITTTTTTTTITTTITTSTDTTPADAEPEAIVSIPDPIAPPTIDDSSSSESGDAAVTADTDDEAASDSASDSE